ncbi:MAG: hypothetical protein UU49_C0039G0002 [Candidatus Magasanikbacteria bacterium GW2011_GWC2_41_17]|uniref:Uncharacterized protein n=1 Tax=Candidatus Magasanikbacteria bacterium GW2011_GWC2_41_17 TaxID=1619048 RepID=A0A0G0XJ54_9BACT|nr:MAG: hypothetical protein UU49_C0039G0002 [Candidatus Magasanikbacteria bacterium GW2011_GWC2_41_17]
MKNDRESGASGQVATPVESETKLPDIVLVDDDGKEIKVPGSLIGKWLPLVGKVDKYSIENNHDLLEGLKAGWFKKDGTLSDAGEAEASRRAGATKEAGEKMGWSFKTQEANKEAEIKKARKGFLGTIQRKVGGLNEKKSGDPKEQVRTALAKYGYTGDSELKRINGGGNYSLRFFNTDGQAEEDQVFVGNMSKLLDYIDGHVGRILKK